MAVRIELGQTSGDDEGQGGLVFCSPWDRIESEMIELLNNNNNRNKGKDLLENEVRMALHLIELQGEKEEESILGSWQGTDV